MVKIEKKNGLDGRTAAIQKGYIERYVRVEALQYLVQYFHFQLAVLRTTAWTVVVSRECKISSDAYAVGKGETGFHGKLPLRATPCPHGHQRPTSAVP